MIVNERFDQIMIDFIQSKKSELQTTKISIVIPCYNEEKSICDVLSKIPELPNAEIIVVDDGSSDRSKELISQFDCVNLICHDVNSGYGKTLLDGILMASGDIIITMDADGQHEPRDIISLIHPIIENKADIVVGSRYKGMYYYNLPWTTRVGEAFVEFVLWLLFGAKIKNNQGGFRAFKRNTILPIFGDIEFLGFEFATETLIKGTLGKYRITEVPIHLYNREFGKSRINLPKLLISLLHCFMHYSILQRFGIKVLDKFSLIVKKLRLSKLYE